MEPVIFFTSPPNLEELCGFTVLVKQLDQPPFASVQPPHITKCREMIFTEPDLIASPSYDLDACFNIIMLQSHFKSGKVQKRLHSQGMQLSKPYRVLPSVYQSCLHYTVLARLAPSWNKAGEWLIQGRDFLVHTGYTNAVKLKLCVNKDEMFVSLIGTVVRFPPLQIEDLNLSHQEMQQIVTNAVHEVTLADNWCHVLPSMKRGRIISLSLQMSRESPFTSYRDLQRHWKNMYGYRLPDTDEDILYCQVAFLPSGGGKHFTYPSVCLRSGPLQMIQRVDPKPVLAAFLQNVHEKVGKVCGHLLRFQSKLCFAFPSLHAACQETGGINLSSTPVNKPVVPLRSTKSMSQLYNSMIGDKKTTIRQALHEQKTEKVKDDIKDIAVSLSDTQFIHEFITQVDTTDTPVQTRAPNSNHNRIHTLIQKMHERDPENLFDLSSNGEPHNSPAQIHNTKPADGELSVTQSGSTRKFVPHFRSQSRQHSDKKCSDSDCGNSKSNSFIPIFKPHTSKTDSVSSCTNKTRIQHSHVEGNDIQESLSTKILTGTSTFKTTNTSQHSMHVLVPHFRKQLTQSRKPDGVQKQVSSLPKLSSHSVTSNVKPARSTEKQNENSILHPSLRFSLGSAISMNTLSATTTDVSGTCMIPPKLSQVNNSDTEGGKHCGVKRKTLTEAYRRVQTTKSKLRYKHNCKTSLLVFKLSLKTWKDLAEIALNEEQVYLGASPQPKKVLTAKWKTDVESTKNGEDIHKKSRVKPQVQDLDVESLAKSNQLGKVNAVTLMAWLKVRGVICRSKEKKTELVEKVNNYICTARPER